MDRKIVKKATELVRQLNLANKNVKILEEAGSDQKNPIVSVVVRYHQESRAISEQIITDAMWDLPNRLHKVLLDWFLDERDRLNKELDEL